MRRGGHALRGRRVMPDRGALIDVATVHVDMSTRGQRRQPGSTRHGMSRIRAGAVRVPRLRRGDDEPARRAAPAHAGRRSLVPRSDRLRSRRLAHLPRRSHHRPRADGPRVRRARSIGRRPPRHRGILPTSHPFTAEVLVHVEPNDARRRYSSFAVIEATDDGRSILRIGVLLDRPIARYVASMSCEWQVLRPPELIDALVAHAGPVRRFARG